MPGPRQARGRAGDDPLEQLTPREREVLGLMAEGRSNGPIAADRRRVLAVLHFLDQPG